MRKYTYWIVAAFIIGTVVYFISRPELEPQNLPKIKYTQVENPAAFGELILEKLSEEVKRSPILLLGVTPDHTEDLEVWKGFLAATVGKAGLHYDVVVAEMQLPGVDVLSPTLKLDIKKEMDRMVEGVSAAREKGLRVVIIAPSIYTSQLLSRNPAEILKQEKGLSFTSFSLAKYPSRREEEDAFQPVCSVDNEDREGTGPLGCAIRTKARRTYSARVEAGKFSGFADQLSNEDFLILFNRN